MSNATCPSCSELAAIHECLKDYAIYDGEPPLLALSMLLSEVKMWRSKDEYDKKMKVVMGQAILKQINGDDEDDGNEVAGQIFGLN
jgi:hypothetical protein